jgi:uncharacterized protein YbjT (DUF2867 family)
LVADGTVLIVGGTGGIGREVARHYQEQGSPVLITGRDPERAAATAKGLGSGVSGLGFDLGQPESIKEALREVGPVLLRRCTSRP